MNDEQKERVKELVLGTQKIARLVRYSLLRDDYAEEENTIEEIVDQQQYVEREPGMLGHATGASVVRHMQAMANVGNLMVSMAGDVPAFGCDVIDADAETKRACFECNHVYDGLIVCPECGEAAGEPLGMEE